MTENSFTLIHKSSYGWVLSDKPTVALLRDTDSQWLIMAEVQDQQLLAAAGIPCQTALDISLRSLTTIVANIFHCSPSLKRRGNEYLIGTTGYYVYRYEKRWYLGYRINDCSSAEQRIIKDVAQQIFMHSPAATPTYYVTRNEALQLFKMYYTDAQETESRRSTLQKYAHSLSQSIRGR